MAQIGRFGDGAIKTAEDTAPQVGLVQNVCKQWVVHEDEGLAHRLQKEEFQTHFGHNKEQRRVIRGDIKEAKIAFSEELTEIEKQRQRHLQQLRELEQRDQRVAENLQKKLLEEESRQLSVRQEQDEELALELQLREEEKRRRITEELSSRRPMLGANLSAGPDVSQEKFQRLRQRPSQLVGSSSARNIPVQDLFSSQPSTSVNSLARKSSSSAGGEDDQRRKQELEDEKLARQLQEMEQTGTVVKDDYQLAMESQDAEYARLLDEKEKERQRRLQEKHLAKKASLEQQRDTFRPDTGRDNSPPQTMDMAGYPARYHPAPPRLHNEPYGDMTDTSTDLAIVSRQGSSGEEANNGRMRGSAGSITNVATLIDPTYRPPLYHPDAPRSDVGNTQTRVMSGLRQTASANSAPVRSDGHWEVNEGDAPFTPGTVVKDDYQLAMESQDAEYARLLDEKEKERQRRLQEKHLAKKASLEQQRDTFRPDTSRDNSPPQTMDMTGYPARYHPAPPRLHNEPYGDMTDTFTDLAIVSRQRSSGEEANNGRMRGSAGPIANVATLIDPTYRPLLYLPGAPRSDVGNTQTRVMSGLRQTASANSAPVRSDGHWEVNEGDAPFTPVSQLRQTRSLQENQGRDRGGYLVSTSPGGERNTKGKDKESCKTQ